MPRPVVTLDLPVIQIRDLAAGETVGYGNTWTAKRPTRIATVAAGYADGIARHGHASHAVWPVTTPCPIVGRVSMDLITVDVTDLDHDPARLQLLGHIRALMIWPTPQAPSATRSSPRSGQRYAGRYTAR